MAAPKSAEPNVLSRSEEEKELKKGGRVEHENENKQLVLGDHI